MVSLEFRFIADAPDFKSISKNAIHAYGVDWIRVVYDIDRARGDSYSMWQSETCGTMPKIRVDIFDQIPYWDKEKIYFENVRIFEQKIRKPECPYYELEVIIRKDEQPQSIAPLKEQILACKSKEGILKLLKKHLGKHFINGTDSRKWYDE